MGSILSCCISSNSTETSYYEFEDAPENIPISSEEAYSSESWDEWIVVEPQTESQLMSKL